LKKFCWYAAGPLLAAFDLRRLGWRLVDPGTPDMDGEGVPLLVHPAALSPSCWLSLAGAPRTRRCFTAMLGVVDPIERGRLLRLGFGEALGWTVLAELECRIERMCERASALPRRRQVGALVLDLIAREAFVAGRALGLFPREFDLLWRLTDAPGQAVAAPQLLKDVWRLTFLPETNTLAVHVSRLRGKLRLGGLDGLIETLPDGSYRLAVGLQPGDLVLDGSGTLGKEHRREDSGIEGQDTHSCAMT